MDYENLGAYPIDSATPVGQLRIAVGDVSGTEFVPALAGFRSYKYFSDAELAVFITTSGGSIMRAHGLAYMQLGAVLGEQQAARIAAKDLSVDLSRKGGSFMETGKALLIAANAAESAQASQATAFYITGGY